MKAKKLTPQRAVKLLAEFYEAHTPEEMENSFNWTHTPEVLGANERVYAYYEPEDPDTIVGFGVLEMNLRDARDTEAFLSCGVFKAHRRKGYWHKIMEHLRKTAKNLGADFCSRTVNKVNEEHYARSIRESHGDSGWIHAGDHWHPAPGYGYFVWLFDKEDRAKAKKEDGCGEHQEAS